jgi:hypothetical protein
MLDIADIPETQIDRIKFTARSRQQVLPVGEVNRRYPRTRCKFPCQKKKIHKGMSELSKTTKRQLISILQQKKLLSFCICSNLDLQYRNQGQIKT